MELRDYLRILRRRWVLIAATAIVVASVAFVTAPGPRRRGAPVSGTGYTASVTLIQAPDAGSFSSQSLATVALLATRGEVPQRVATRLHYDGPPAVLAAQVSTSYDATVGSISITATNVSATTATDTANAFGSELLGYLGDRAVSLRQQAIDQIDKTLSDEQASIHQLDTQLGASSAGTAKDLLQSQRDAIVAQYGRTYSQLESAQSQSTAPTLVLLQSAQPIPHTSGGIIRAPSTRLGRTFGGFVLGLIIGAGAGLALERLGDKIGSRDQAEALLDLPVIADVPYLPVWQRRTPGPVALMRPTSPAAEAYHLVASSLFAMRTPPRVGPSEGHEHLFAAGSGEGDVVVPRRAPQLVLVTSACAGDGKSSTAANLAVCLAEAGRSALLIDSDFRRPSAHRFFGLDNGIGLSDFLAYRVGKLTNFVRPTKCAGVSVVSTGPPIANPLSLLSGLRGVLQQARQIADVVVIDTSPLLSGSEVIELLSEVDAVLLVCRAGRTSGQNARHAADLLNRFGAPVLGTVLMGERGGLHLPLSPYYWYRDDRMLAPRVKPPPITPIRVVDDEVHEDTEGRRSRESLLRAALDEPEGRQPIVAPSPGEGSGIWRP